MPERERAAAPSTEPAVAAEPAADAALAPPLRRILGMQRSAGNVAVSRLLARQPAPATTPATAPATEEEAIAQAEAFFRSGPFTGTLTPGADISHGGFDATYDPPNGLLTIKMKVGINFVHGLTDGTPVTAGDASLNIAATHANSPTLTPPQRAAFVAQYRWQDAEKEPWRNQLKTTIDSTWSGQHEFHLNKPGFEWIGAKVKVDLDVHDAVASGTDHLQIRALKTPPGTNLYTPLPGQGGGGFSSTSQGTATNAFDQTMTVASTDLGPRPDVDFLNHSVLFDHDKADLTAAATAELDRFITTFGGQPGDPRSVQMPVTLVGHASSSGAASYNQTLSEKRVAAVKKYFEDHGFGNVSTRVKTRGEGERGADPVDNPADRRVDVTAGDGRRQSLIAHEFGHAFGLGDEYVVTGAAGYVGSGTGGTTGAVTPASHDAATKAMQDAGGANLPGAIQENSDSIMSLGTVIRPQHYSTFHKALTDITHQEPWALGPPRPHPLGRTPAP